MLFEENTTVPIKVETTSLQLAWHFLKVLKVLFNRLTHNESFIQVGLCRKLDPNLIHSILPQIWGQSNPQKELGASIESLTHVER